MKLISLCLQNDFNSLRPFEPVNIAHVDRDDGKIDPLCLIGINGSGKSNLLELIAEAFYYFELNHRFETDKRIKKRAIRQLELIYSLAKHDNKRIKINTYANLIPKLYVEYNPDQWIEIIDSEDILNYLPIKVIGYTSGMNETLSFRFNQLDSLYSDDVLLNAKAKSKEILPENRLVFLDNESNQAIVISNFLFKDTDQLRIFKDLLRITGLDTFKIIIDLKRKRSNDYVVLSHEHLDYIEKFKLCSVCYREEPLQYYEFDFIVNPPTKTAFLKHFITIDKLFMAFQKFKLLNPINLDKPLRKVKSEDDLLDNKPTLAKSDKVFRFEELNLLITNPDKSIPYIGISDGEHQFLQIVGSAMIFEQNDVLFLFDEPETHFNPSWRTKFIQVLNATLKNRNQDIVITTHSPFIVSDCKGYRVYKFMRIEGDSYFENIGIETFGTSYDVILKKAFNIDNNISQEANQEINLLLTSDDADKIQDFIDESGPSFEKLALLKHLKTLKSN
jgi:restriction system-associated AAA family ATPase